MPQTKHRQHCYPDQVAELKYMHRYFERSLFLFQVGKLVLVCLLDQVQKLVTEHSEDNEENQVKTDIGHTELEEKLVHSG